MRARSRKAKGKAPIEKGRPRIGDSHVLTIGSPMEAILVTIARSIILVDNLVDVLSVGQQSTIHHSASPIKPKSAPDE